MRWPLSTGCSTSLSDSTALGGSLRVENDEGTRITLQFPLEEGTAPEESSENDDAEKHRTAGRAAGGGSKA